MLVSEMTATHRIGVDEYLHMCFEPHAEYVEGQIVERSVPNEEHSSMQSYLIEQLRLLGRGHNFVVRPELRIQTTPSRFRIPDLCLRHRETDQIELTIEIISPDDALSEVWQKIREYLNLGIPAVWLIDPATRTGEMHSADAVERDNGGLMSYAGIVIDLNRVSD